MGIAQIAAEAVAIVTPQRIGGARRPAALESVAAQVPVAAASSCRRPRDCLRRSIDRLAVGSSEINCSSPVGVL